MLVSGTLELSGSHAVVVGVAEIYGLWWIAFSVIRTIFFHFVVSVAVAQVLDGFGEIFYGFHHFICMCDGGSRKFPVEKMYCVCELLVAGGFYVAPMCAVVFRQCL